MTRYHDSGASARSGAAPWGAHPGRGGRAWPCPVVVRAKQDTGQAKQDTVRSNQDTAFFAEPEHSGGSVKNALAPPSPTFTA